MVLLTIVGSVFFAAAVVLAAAHLQELKARRCWAKVSELGLGRATLQDARSISDRFGGTDSRTVGRPCTAEFCDFTFAFENRWLSRTHLAPYAGVTIEMVVSKGRLISRGLAYTVAAANASYAVGEHLPSPGSSRFRVITNTDLYGAPNKVSIELTTEASRQELERAYSIDWSCLASIRGCQDRYKVFPLLNEIQKEGRAQPNLND